MGRKPFLYHPNPAGWNHPPTTGIACGFLSATKIIYEIATHFILGFHDEVGQGCDTNFELADSAELAKEGKLEAFVEQAFGHKLSEA